MYRCIILAALSDSYERGCSYRRGSPGRLRGAGQSFLNCAGVGRISPREKKVYNESMHHFSKHSAGLRNIVGSLQGERRVCRLRNGGTSASWVASSERSYRRNVWSASSPCGSQTPARIDIFHEFVTIECASLSSPPAVPRSAESLALTTWGAGEFFAACRSIDHGSAASPHWPGCQVT